MQQTADYFYKVVDQWPGQFEHFNQQFRVPYPDMFPKIAGFDLFNTLIKTKSNAKFPKSSIDWELLHGNKTK